MIRCPLPTLVVLTAAMVGGCLSGAPGRVPTAPEGEQLCAGWIKRHDQVACYVPLTPVQASHRTKYAKLIVKGGRVVRMSMHTGAGGIATDDSGDAGFDATFEESGSSRLWVDRWGEKTGVSRVRPGRWEKLTPWGAPGRDKPEDGYIHLTTNDALGFVATDKVVDEQGRPATIAGVHETRWVHDAEGHTVETSTFGVDGKPVANARGVHRTKDRPGVLGCVAEWQTFDVDNRPFGGAIGVYRGLRRCDEWGNGVGMRWVDAAGVPMINRQGIHGWDEKLDAHGALLAHVTVGLDGKPAPVNGQESLRREKVDARGYTIERWFFDANGAPFVTTEGNSGLRFVVAPNGAQLGAFLLDANGAPIVVDAGHAGWKSTVDSRGRVLGTAYFDEQGKPSKRSAGAFVDYTYDEHGLVATVTTRDAQGGVFATRDGFAKVAYTRDAEGRIVRRTHYDADGNQVHVPALRWLFISWAGAKGARPAAITREEAERRARLALERLARNEPWLVVAKQLTETTTDEPRFAGKSGWYAPLWEAAEKLKAGDPPVLVDTERGYMIVERTE
jgi:YD repeat-containing protein